MGVPDAATIEAALLAALKDGEVEDTWGFATSLGCPHNAVVGVLKSLEGESMAVSELRQTQFLELSDDGRRILEIGSPEVRVFEAVPVGEAGASKAELEAALGADVVKVGMGLCMKNKWLAKGSGTSLVRSADAAPDAVREALREVAAALSADGGGGGAGSDEAGLKELRRRRLVQQVTRKSFAVRRGPTYSSERRRRAADLTKEMLDGKEWQTTAFKEYNFHTLGVPVGGGYLHPLLKVRAEFRRILMNMGFEEMPTHRWVESAFWNFDALFQPQSHPARDAHDTFFIREPATARALGPEDYVEAVRQMHEVGGHGSAGYRYDWKRAEAEKNLLRTHTTAISSQMLHRLAATVREGGGGKFVPRRYFSIDRVFRNESMDATHLCEFHQVEGLVADRNLCLGDLIGTIKTFFEQIGITQVRFKPAYNPYTEPSMEIFGYHPDLKKWTEIGNSGMFRPEMLRPMGFPEDVRVIAWGLSLERPTMIKYRIANIRELFGHKANLGRTRRAPMARFDV
ncbi:unnamed protein product [Phaeothamnion confervicola]